MITRRTSKVFVSSSEIPENSKRDSYVIGGEVWYSLKQDNWVPDRQAWVIDQWCSTFTAKPLKDFNKIMELVSRSSVLGNWYSDVMEKYRDQVAIPIHVQDVLGTDEYEKVSKQIAGHNQRIGELAKAKEEAAKQYRKVLDKIDREYSDIESARKESPLLFILTLTSDRMPLGILDRINEYVPRDESDPITAKVFAREQLLRYQRYLLERYRNGEDPKDIVENEQMQFVNPID